MPLHLLGKKSWNVYNKDNIERVRRDEARAKAEEEENERKQREEDAERRIDILRGKIPLPLNDAVDEKERHSRSREKPPVESRHRKRRRLAGENDTDRDIRFAKEDAELARQRVESKASRRRTDDAPIVDKSGHISLFPEESMSRTRRSDKNPEAEAETAKKNQEFEDQYMMRLSNAAGYKQQLTSTPWYSSNTEISTQNAGLPNKNVWGDEDPRRQEREKIRIATNDPLTAMKKGVKQLKEVEKERTKWAEERERELKALKREDRDKEKRQRRRHQGGKEGTIEAVLEIEIEIEVAEGTGHGMTRHTGKGAMIDMNPKLGRNPRKCLLLGVKLQEKDTVLNSQALETTSSLFYTPIDTHKLLII
ncbi:TPA_exp: Uncharacterized protein A8136_0738 [Trichophyton benhamiae CBS 112371]|nr:TPA_exp: Uncharacterized protein A8136_0738 [Trichophyton benhamiae CBS 112371]